MPVIILISRVFIKPSNWRRYNGLSISFIWFHFPNLKIIWLWETMQSYELFSKLNENVIQKTELSDYIWLCLIMKDKATRVGAVFRICGARTYRPLRHSSLVCTHGRRQWRPVRASLTVIDSAFRGAVPLFLFIVSSPSATLPVADRYVPLCRHAGGAFQAGITLTDGQV